MTIPIYPGDLPAYPSVGGPTRLRLVGASGNLALRADGLIHALDEAVAAFGGAFAEQDQRAATEDRIRAAAKRARGR